ncbi:MAG TPA: hypothetical protein VFQ15_04155, partial [Jiangellaceae bacterium]|nr:hypothetical protein [Jiangellaceae bacterium]
VVITPQVDQDGEMSFVATGRKLIVEPVAKGPKQVAQTFVIEKAPIVHVTLLVDELGRIVEAQQKPVFPQTKVRRSSRPGSGQAPLLVPPGNDACATPFVIGNGATPFTTVEATTDGIAPGCSGTANIHKDVWYDYTATATGVLTVSTCNAATFDTKIAIYSGLTCPTGAPIGCNDDFGGCAGFTSTATAPVVLGAHYLIRVGGFSSTTPTGTGTLTITPPVGPPAFDVCSGAQSVSCGSSTAFNNAAATTSGSDPLYSCRVGGPAQGFGTSWFTFMATSTTAVIDTNGSSTGDTLLAAYSGTRGALVEIGCDDDGGTGLLSLVNLAGLTVGQTYYIQVAGWGAGNVGNNVLNVTCGPPPGDACADAIPVPCGGSETVSNGGFGTDASDPVYSCRIPSPAQGVGTAWFTFVATHTSANVNTLGSTAFDTLLAVYSGTCGSFTELACDDDTFGLLSDLCVEGLTIGQTYYIQAASYSVFDLGDIQVNIECPCPAPPANDECENAIALGAPPFSVNFDTTLATSDIDAPCGVASGPWENVWHTVTGTGNTITLTTCNGGTTHPDTKISVFCGECLELVCVSGNDDDCPGGGPIFASTVSWCSQLGVQYLVTTGGFAPGQEGFVQLDAFDDGVPCDAVVQCLPTGACCLPDGSCVVLLPDDCAAQGGTYQGDGTECTSNAIVDGSYEAGPFSGNWNEFSTNFGTPLCDVGSCGTGTGTGPNTGLIWAWFGGIPAFEEGSTSQAVTIPVGATTLDFYLEIPVGSGNGVDFLEVTIDGIQEYLVLESAGPYLGYALQQVDISGYADGGVHTIDFHSICTGTDVTNFFVDDVSINTVSINCPQPTGACCLEDGSCVEVTEEECAEQGGTFSGDGSLCFNVFCPQPVDCFVLDFETDDSGAAMAHGARVNTEYDGGF